jgi:chromosome segregation ATPase
VGIFRKPADPIGETEASLVQLRRRRDVLATKLAEVKIGCEKAQDSWQAALDGDDPSRLEKAGTRLAGAKEIAALLEGELDDCARQIAIAETELSFAQDRVGREAKAARLDQQAKTIAPMFDRYGEACARFAEELSRIDFFDAQAAASIILQTSEAVLGAKQSILDQMRFMAAELRREPTPRVAEPKLPAGVLPRGIVPGRNDTHQPQFWSGDKMFPAG